MTFAKITLFSVAFNFLIIGLASAYYFVIPQMYFSRSKDFANLYYKCTSCAIAEQNATKDFNKGEYSIIWWGLGDGNNVLIKSILSNDYKIDIIRGGCTRLTEIDCYNIKMHQLLFKKYGDFIFYTNQKAEGIKHKD